jgi:hypothetical protein
MRRTTCNEESNFVSSIVCRGQEGPIITAREEDMDSRQDTEILDLRENVSAEGSRDGSRSWGFRSGSSSSPTILRSNSKTNLDRKTESVSDATEPSSKGGSQMHHNNHCHLPMMPFDLQLLVLKRLFPTDFHFL